MITLGKYELNEQIGKGGFGSVYLAIDTSLGREVAIKVLHPQLMVDEAFVERFKKEAKVLASFDHPNIVSIYDMGEIDGRAFIAMRYLSGGSLQAKIQAEKKIQFEETKKIMAQVCDGLQVAHEKGLVHRDLKPANILFDNRGNAVISDFGLAKVVQMSGASSSMGIVGTPAYRAPELWRGKPAATPATDVYSLGCILVEMLTGKVLFDGDTPDVIITQHLVDGPQLHEKISSMMHEGIFAILEKALDKDQSVRQSCADVFLHHLLGCQNFPHVLSNDNEIIGEKGSPIIISSKQESTKRADETIEIKEIEREEVNNQSNEKKIELALGLFMEFVRIAKGEFLMGSTADDKYAVKDEKPQHKAQLDEYWIGKYPVTNVEYSAFLKATTSKPLERWNDVRIPVGKENHPVVNVTWEDACYFCDWLSEKIGRRVRLPSEAEWEKAARGPKGYIYPWGNDVPDDKKCNFNIIKGETTEVGFYSPVGDSPFGCADMAGNVSEWVKDWYDADYYSKTSSVNPIGPDSGNDRIVKGGSWILVADYCRVANRMHRDPSTSDIETGFRCVLLS